MTALVATFTCTFVTRTVTGTDADGNDVTTDTTVAVPGCVFAPGASTEVLGNQDTVVDQPVLYAPTGTVVTAVSAVIVPGFGTYEVAGNPNAWPANPFTGRQPAVSVEIKLRAVVG